MDSIITVGITGGIGTGKSIICRALNIMGYPVFYSDTEARQILESDEFAIRQVVHLFGEKAYAENKLQSKVIADLVFKNPDLRLKLNEITHPLVRARFEGWAKSQKSKVVFNEAAILFETGSYKNFSHTILVVAPRELRMQRLLERDKVPSQKIEERMAAQWEDDRKIPLASFIIYNDEKQLLLPQIQTILTNLGV